MQEHRDHRDHRDADMPKPHLDRVSKVLPSKLRCTPPQSTEGASSKRVERSLIASPDEEDTPARPCKRTPRVNSSSSLIFTPDNGGVLTRKLVPTEAERGKA
jgi:hypothetical protein